MADMDPASIRAAAYMERQAKARAEYECKAREDAERYGTVTFTVGNQIELEAARDSMLQNHLEAKRVQRIFINNKNKIVERNLMNNALDMANQYKYYLIFISDNPNP
ncbi:hypothetical protein L195_g061047 [Trifolium pratense]|uniref:Uncharacterized protein n=1 Tax=Trifolium pratense TaxID=57577 RepID=A0A2K3K7H0_TRIPR|nr:hypothetical protein L195_g061047 [Trifolium pratense]